MSVRQESELAVALEQLSAAMSLETRAGLAALERVSEIAGETMPAEVCDAIRVSLKTGDWLQCTMTSWRIIRNRTESWVVTCPPDDGGGVPRLLWTDPWPHGQRHLDTVRADASNLTRLLFGYATSALPGWMSARAIRHVTGPAPPTDALRRIRLAGWTVAHRSSWLLTCSSPPGAAPLDTADQVLCCLNLGAYACVMGEEGPLSPTRVQPRASSGRARDRAAALVGILGSWLARQRLGALGPSDARSVLSLHAQSLVAWTAENDPARDVLRIWIGRTVRDTYVSTVNVARLGAAARSLLDAALPLLMRPKLLTFSDFDRWFDEQIQSPRAGGGKAPENS